MIYPTLSMGWEERAASKVSYLAAPRNHGPGQFLPLATGSFLVSRLAELLPLETVRLPEDAHTFRRAKADRGCLERLLSANLEFRRAYGSVVNKQKFIMFGARNGRATTA
jgi:hypothetical protein